VESPGREAPAFVRFALLSPSALQATAGVMVKGRK
jgi:hypothetical protein